VIIQTPPTNYLTFLSSSETYTSLK